MPKNQVIFLFLVILLGVWVIQGIYLPVSNEKNSEGFRIESGQGVFEVSKELEKRNLIKDDFWFNVYFLLRGRNKTLKAGSYSLNRAMNVTEIFGKIRNGKTNPNKITIVEGQTTKDIGERLEKKDWCSTEDFYNVVGYPNSQNGNGNFELTLSFEEEYEFLKSKPDNASLEGFLFPDTYYLNKQDGPKVLTKKMLDNFKEKFNSLNADTDRTVFEIVTMASLIEKEVKTLKDKKIVSGILWKRFKNGLPIQVDATISYITGEDTTDVSINETEINSPYNTYKYRGLPKGPICNPGLESIEAALNPISTDYWYYLSVPSGKCPKCSEGGTYFSETLQQHQFAKQKYLDN